MQGAWLRGRHQTQGHACDRKINLWNSSEASPETSTARSCPALSLTTTGWTARHPWRGEGVQPALQTTDGRRRIWTAQDGLRNRREEDIIYKRKMREVEWDISDHRRVRGTVMPDCCDTPHVVKILSEVIFNFLKSYSN